MATGRPFTQKRAAWLLLAASAAALFAAALWFQYGQGLDPCVMCVYERLAVIGLLTAGLIGSSAPARRVLRWAGYLLWGVSAGWGLSLALEHIGFETDTGAALNCSFLPDFPAWLPLREWLPAVFLPTGYCDDVQWHWLSLTMAEWMAVIFAFYLLLMLAVAATDLTSHMKKT